VILYTSPVCSPCVRMICASVAVSNFPDPGAASGPAAAADLFRLRHRIASNHSIV
jgi:hypothetical protein